MANPATREQLKQYALRTLGKPVIEINVDDDQAEDRIDEALQYFAQYHYDGVERTYLKYKVTQADVDRMKSPSGDTASSITKNSVTNSSPPNALKADVNIAAPTKIINTIEVVTQVSIATPFKVSSILKVL